MSKSLSIFTASPNIAKYCARFANCHMLRNFCKVLGGSAVSSTSISLAARLRVGIVVERAVGDAFERRVLSAKVVVLIEKLSQTGLKMCWTRKIARGRWIK